MTMVEENALNRLKWWLAMTCIFDKVENLWKIIEKP
jgi:hypothetical protein